MKLGPIDIRWSVDNRRFYFIVFANDEVLIEQQPGLAWINTCSGRVNRAIAWLGGWR